LVVGRLEVGGPGKNNNRRNAKKGEQTQLLREIKREFWLWSIIGPKHISIRSFANMSFTCAAGCLSVKAKVEAAKRTPQDPANRASDSKGR